MEIILNGEKKTIETGTSLKILISNFTLDGKKFVTVVNGDIVKEENYHEHILEDKSKVDLISIVGGG